MTKEFKIGNVKIGGKNPLVLIAGPCVLETHEITFKIAGQLKKIAKELRIPLIFKASYDKANRTSIKSFRGPGIYKGLNILEKVKKEFNIPVLTDVHCVSEVSLVTKVADVIQIPAFLCRQTDLILAVAMTKKPINIKKGQFLSPYDMKNVVEKIESAGNKNILLTERGTSFGYNNLIVDIRSIMIMRNFGYPVVFDATHSVQLPGGFGSKSGGQQEFILPLSKAAVAVGVDALFMEVHTEPEKALSDSANSIKISELKNFMKKI
ncbi:MAG: 3-deoxy-8-phosphooctulonate synthase [Elusimicrobia bacterium RIFOXYC2_FULL_34_12]|nr:MAG: 3-deoxy-8-phosphooctulonate synthase [Elusimicrobia bacterium RIFOXYC2_FULL_34_12]OGS38866.1 MAG: 3-deoxy-8-phosphooctulonate synthase [Elusimicrobia bacterium RIFOXYD2_FULL_34_30]HAM39063.1 3-deoxy-8-phosphooctulonate synthase [Elusimicrobiota bacterium]